MAHNTRTQIDATWTTGNYVTVVADWQSLERKVFKAINGVTGGCWAPSSQLVLGSSVANVIINAAAPAIVDWDGTLSTLSGGRFVLDSSGPDPEGDWAKLVAGHAGRTRTLVTQCVRRTSSPKYRWVAHRPTWGVQAIACTVQGPAGVLEQPACIVELRTHHKATLSSVTLTWRVPSTRTNAPVVPPKIRIVRVDANGIITPLKSVASGADANGYIAIAAPTSGAAWFNSGGVQSFTYLCDQNSVVDVTQYTYFAQIQEEAGTLFPVPAAQCDGTIVRERKADVTSLFTANTAITGGAIATGTRVLLTAQTIAQQNGIWIANSSAAWTRATDLQSASDFTPNFIVQSTADGTVWQLAAPTNAQQITLSTDTTGTPISFQRRAATGNIYHALAASFTGIADMRWQ